MDLIGVEIGRELHAGRGVQAVEREGDAPGGREVQAGVSLAPVLDQGDVGVGGGRDSRINAHDEDSVWSMDGVMRAVNA